MQRGAFAIPQVLLNQVPHDGRLGATPRPGMTFQKLDLMPFHFKRNRFHRLRVLL